MTKTVITRGIPETVNSGNFPNAFNVETALYCSLGLYACVHVGIFSVVVFIFLSFSVIVGSNSLYCIYFGASWTFFGYNFPKPEPMWMKSGI